MRVLNELKYMLEEQVKEMTKDGDINVKELECLDKAVDIIKDIETIEAMKQYGYEEEDMKYSNAMRGGRGNSYAYNSSNGYSGHMMPYDMYEREMYDDMSYGRGSYDGGSYMRGRSPRTGRYIRMNQYSRDEKKDEMIEKLEHMMKEAVDESSRMAIQKCIEKLERE